MYEQILAALIRLVHFEHMLRVVEFPVFIAELAEVGVAVRLVHGSRVGWGFPADAGHQRVVGVVRLAVRGGGGG